MKRLILALALVAPAAMSSSAFAQQPAKAPATPQAHAPAAAPMQGDGADATFAAWDKNHDGMLSKDEFRAGYLQARDAIAMQRLRMEFQRHDANNSGKLEADEYAKLMVVQRAGKGAPMMSAFDKDKNQSLDFQEYLDVLKTLARPQPAAAAPNTK